MEDILDVYALPRDDDFPVVCFDESPHQLIEHVREPEPCAPGVSRREDFEYRRCGVVNAMMICQPAAGLRTCLVSEFKTKIDFAHCCEHIAALFPKAVKIKLVIDNLSTHTAGAFYKAFDPQKASWLRSRFEFHFTPKHGSWLNIAELELSVLSRRVFKKRIGTADAFQKEIDACCAQRNAEGKPVQWVFTSTKARSTMARSYPVLKENPA
jgi:hypothetical protein